MKKRIVILGSGFAGIYSYLHLHDLFHGHGEVEIYMVSDNDHFLFVPLVHEVATGNLLPSSIRQSVRTVPQCCLDDFIPGKVTRVDFDNKLVSYTNTYLRDDTDDKIEEGSISFDYLIIGLGSETAYFGVPGANEFSLPLKDLSHARAIKNTLLRRFEAAQLSMDKEERERLLTFVIVGGGPTGVELAGELSDILAYEMADAYPKIAKLAKVIVIEGGEVLLQNIGGGFSQKALNILKKKGNVEVMLNTRVHEVQGGGVSTGESFISAETVIWTAGVQAQEFEIVSQKEIEKEERTKRIKVTKNLNLESYPEVFVAGDQAYVCDIENKQAYPMRAQFAVREGMTSAENIFRMIYKEPDLMEFRWQDKGIIVSIGKGGALAKVGGVELSGLPAWIMYRGAYLFKILGVRAKIRTAVEWTLNFFNPRDISEI